MNLTDEQKNELHRTGLAVVQQRIAQANHTDLELGADTAWQAYCHALFAICDAHGIGHNHKDTKAYWPKQRPGYGYRRADESHRAYYLKEARKMLDVLVAIG